MSENCYLFPNPLRDNPFPWELIEEAIGTYDEDVLDGLGQKPRLWLFDV